PGSGTLHHTSLIALATLPPSAIFTAALAPLDMIYVKKQAAIITNNFCLENMLPSEFKSAWKIPGTKARFKSAYKEGFVLTLFSEILKKTLKPDSADTSYSNNRHPS